MKDGILIASFGTTAPGAYQRTMGVLAREVRRRWPGAGGWYPGCGISRRMGSACLTLAP